VNDSSTASVGVVLGEGSGEGGGEGSATGVGEAETGEGLAAGKDLPASAWQAVTIKRTEIRKTQSLRIECIL
jgi:hypothetical protein